MDNVPVPHKNLLVLSYSPGELWSRLEFTMIYQCSCEIIKFNFIGRG
jgi:hypothetical protein